MASKERALIDTYLGAVAALDSAREAIVLLQDKRQKAESDMIGAWLELRRGVGNGAYCINGMTTLVVDDKTNYPHPIPTTLL